MDILLNYATRKYAACIISISLNFVAHFETFFFPHIFIYFKFVAVIHLGISKTKKGYKFGSYEVDFFVCLFSFLFILLFSL